MGGESGKNIGPLYTVTGQIAPQDVAHEMYNQTEEDRLDEGGPEKVGYFNAHGTHARAIQRAYNTVDLERGVRIDPKTGLPNDVEFTVVLSNVLEQVRSGEISGVGIAMFDWDTFGWINDFFNGHDFGDLFLRHGANRMQRHIRGADSLFRRSGDEFYAIFVGLTDRDGLRHRLEELNQDFRDHAFRDTIESALQSSRRVQIAKNKYERDGVCALQKVFQGLMDVQEIKEKQLYFIEQGKGVKEEREKLIKTVSGLDLGRFEPLIALGDRTTFDLNSYEWREYQELLGQFVEEVIGLFDNITLSCGVMVITKENVTDVSTIRNKLDTAMYDVKEHGRNSIKILETP